MADGVITGIFHVSIKTADLEKSRRFYKNILGLTEVDRPPLPFPGAWFGVPTPVGEAIIHMYAGHAATTEPDGSVPVGTKALDHVAMSAIGYDAIRERLRAAGLEWREGGIRGGNLWQLYVFDPSGVQIELSFDARAESGKGPDWDGPKRYDEGGNFFNPADYERI
jgi:catechol 2,3-dioxygenase-like lactoylglutathione lyase family enzyme